MTDIGSIERAPRSILVWLRGALGDTLLAHPTLAALRRWAPAAEIAVAGSPPYWSFAHRMGLADRVVDADGPFGAALVAGDPPPGWAPPDLALVFSAAHAAIARGLRAAGAPRAIGAPPRGLDRRHQARYLLDALRPLGIAPPDRRWASLIAGAGAAAPSHPRPRSRVGGPERPRTAGSPPIVLLHPGAGARWKRWPLGHFRALAQALRGDGLAVHWSVGPADDDLRAALHASGIGAPELWPDLDLPRYAAALARCSLVVSGDTGVAHLAALLGVPQVALFGPTDPRRWRPLSRRAAVLRAPDRCAGRWRGASAGHEVSLARCHPFDPAACRCLAALAPETVRAACLRSNRR